MSNEEKLAFGERFRNGWNAFRNKDPGYSQNRSQADPISPPESVISHIPGRSLNRRGYSGVDQSIATAIYNRIATDAASIRLEHVYLNENDGFDKRVNSALNDVLMYEANADQTGRAFLEDIVFSMLDEGVVACVPIDTVSDPTLSNSYDIQTMRVGKVITWMATKVDVEVYNIKKGMKQTIRLDKRYVAIIENPFYSVMNEPNSTLKRLTRKLALLDTIDESNASSKLDLLIQVPYQIHSKLQREQARDRKKAIEDQLSNSEYGIAYIDGTENVIQLNRPVENNLLGQVEYLTKNLYSQLGITEEILNGTASESAMQNYYTRTIDVILNAITDEFERKFLTKTARTQGQAIRYYRDPFGLTPSSAMPDIADKFSRNEILAPNELRSAMGFRPSADPKSDELRNRNLYPVAGYDEEPDSYQNESMEEY